MDFLEVMNDKGVANRIRMLRKIRNWGVPAKEIEEIEQDHLKALCQELPHALIQREQKLFRIVWEVGKFAVNVTVGHVVSDTAKFVKDILKEITSEAVNEATDIGLDTVKAQERVSKLITKKRQVALAGILRDWLTKRTVIDDRRPQ